MNRQGFITATPESAGVPSRAVTAFLKRLDDNELCMHGVMLFKNGKLLAEGYAPPYTADRKHRMYSISKSFTALGIGIMADEGKLTLDDRIVGHFPEYAPGPVHPFLAEATIRDMLTMRDCHNSTLRTIGEWFSTPPTHPAGTVFMYNTTCTNLLCAIIERISGGTLMEYLYPRMLEPIGFTPGCACIKGTWGYSWSGSGIICTPGDLAKVAMLCMNGGVWDGRRLISESFIKEAVSKQTDNYIANDDPEHQQGYGYQIWRTRFNGFGFFGMGTQLAVALPDKDLLLITTGDTQGTTGGSASVLRSFWETVVPSVIDGVLPEDRSAQQELEDALNDVGLLKMKGAAESPVVNNISGKTYRLFDNTNGWKTARFEFGGGGGAIIYETGRGIKKIPFGFGAFKRFEFPETHFPGMEMRVPSGIGYESYASAGWSDERTLNILCYLIGDYCGNLRITAVFDGDRATIYLKKAAEHFLEEYEGWIIGYAQERGVSL